MTTQNESGEAGKGTCAQCGFCDAPILASWAPAYAAWHERGDCINYNADPVSPDDVPADVPAEGAKPEPKCVRMIRRRFAALQPCDLPADARVHLLADDRGGHPFETYAPPKPAVDGVKDCAHPNQRHPMDRGAGVCLDCGESVPDLRRHVRSAEEARPEPKKPDVIECPGCHRKLLTSDGSLPRHFREGTHEECLTARYQVLADVPVSDGAKETTYPCSKCGAFRTKAEGGTTFTVCDKCWNNPRVGIYAEDVGLAARSAEEPKCDGCDCHSRNCG